MEKQTGPGLIAMITDMGLSDWYVGTMKGVIQSICPEANIVDICHNVDKQLIEQGAFVLRSSFQYFAKGTIFLAVVDPEVGSHRQPIVVRSEDYFFVAPDNGILTFVHDLSKQWEIRAIENTDFCLPDKSDTFHGRDIFAPVAAHLAAGVAFENFGPVLEKGMSLNREDNLSRGEFSIRGRVVYVDTFGNLFTNITKDLIDENIEVKNFHLEICDQMIRGLSPHYAAVPVKHPLFYWGSNGLLEVAMNQGSLAKKWDIRVGEYVHLEWS